MQVSYFFWLVLVFFGVMVGHVNIMRTAHEARTTFEDYARAFFLQSFISGEYLMSKHVIEADASAYPDLIKLVKKLAARANIKVPTTFVITKKAFSYLDKINASSCGDRYHSALCVGSWVLENMTNEELESMLAREIVHIKEDHSFNGEIFYAKVMGPALLIVVLLAQVNFFKKAFGFIGASTSKLAELTALGAVAWGLAYLPAKRNSRKQNQEADIGALELTGHKKLLSALKKMKKWQKKYTAFSYRLGETIPFLFEQSSFAERSKYLRAYDFAR